LVFDKGCLKPPDAIKKINKGLDKKSQKLLKNGLMQFEFKWGENEDAFSEFLAYTSTLPLIDVSKVKAQHLTRLSRNSVIVQQTKLLRNMEAEIEVLGKVKVEINSLERKLAEHKDYTTVTKVPILKLFTEFQVVKKWVPVKDNYLVHSVKQAAKESYSNWFTRGPDL
jgi:hypothetical protein